MIVEVKKIEKQKKDINWDKKMVVYNETEGIILTTGTHKDRYFTGMRINDSSYAINWDKSQFTPCVEPISVTFTNEL